MSDKVPRKRAIHRIVFVIAGAGILLAVGSTSYARRESNQKAQRSQSNANQPTGDEIEELPERVLRHVLRGAELAGAQRYDEAIAEYRAAIKEAGHPVFTAYLNMGSAFFNKPDYPQSVEAFKRALELRPNSLQAHYNLAEALYAIDDYPGAEKEYRRVLTLSSSGSPANTLKSFLAIRGRHFLGLALYKQGRIDEAISEYRASIDAAAGKYSEAHYNLGIALLERDKPVEAEQEFRLAVEQEKKPWPNAQYNLAKALERQKRYLDAADAYEAYLKIAPDAADAQKMRDYIDYLRRKK